jgi:hypothetical protein
MSQELIELIEAAKGVLMTEIQVEEQRVSFAYGNTHFENEQITRATVQEAAEQLREANAPNGRSEG